MRNIALQIVYHGTCFHGYQNQPGQRTVQSCVEEALEILLQLPAPLLCAGRTDAGVHAYAQVVSFQTEHRMPVDRFVPALRSLLPEDLAVVQAWELPPEFNPRASALGRHYRYVLQPGGVFNPLIRQQVWHCPYTVDRTLLQQSWKSLEGTHDFRAFCKSGSYRQHFNSTIYWTRCWEHGPLLVLDIMGRSFLYNMVRTLVGTMVDIARGRLAPETLAQALSSGERRLVGLTAPPQGLYLFNVVYPPEYAIQLIQPTIHSWPVPVTAPAALAPVLAGPA